MTAKQNVEQIEVNNFVRDRAPVIFKELELLCPFKLKQRREGRGDVKGYKSMGVREAEILMLMYPDSKPDPEKTYNSAYAQIAALRLEMLNLRKKEGMLDDHAFFGSMKTLIQNFTDELYSHFSVYRKRYNDMYKDEVKTRSRQENRVEITPQYFIEKAKLVLECLTTDDRKEVNWKDVSCALALCSGRRMIEVHMTGKFEYIDDYTLTFSGQAKGKGRKENGILLKNATFNIPTLIPSYLIIDGIDYLNELGKRPDEKTNHPQVVNSRYSRYLSERIKSMWSIGLGFDEVTYHKLRSVYGICIAHDYCINQGNLLDAYDYLAESLGDSSSDTLRAYSRYKIKPGQQIKF
jgi:hypothetical protein